MVPEVFARKAVPQLAEWRQIREKKFKPLAVFLSRGDLSNSTEDDSKMIRRNTMHEGIDRILQGRS